MPAFLSAPRREIAGILALTLAGAIVRAWNFPRLGLGHFDEGIYALSGLWILQPTGLASIDPKLIPYAPPGFTVLVGLAYFMLGISDLAAISVSLVLGTLTIPAVGWLARRAFGPGAGVAAAALAAFCGPHVAFSRIALTDAGFLLAWLLALGLGSRFLERPGLGRGILLGVAVGIAQNFKYHGWLAGLIVVATGVSLLFGRPRRDAGKRLAWMALPPVFGALVYLPWYQFVEQQSGGYAGLLAHHRTYMGGLALWLPHLRLQLAQAVALSGGPLWGIAAWSLGWVGLNLVAKDSDGLSKLAKSHFATMLIAGATLLAFLPNLSWWLGLAGCAWLIRDTRPTVRLLAIWWIISAILSPLYHPYARLWLPIEAAGWIVLAGLMVDLRARAFLEDREGVRGHRVTWIEPREQVAIALLMLGICHDLGLPPRARPLPDCLAPTDGIRNAVKELAAADPPMPRLFVMARPPVAFYLSTTTRVAFSVIGSWSDLEAAPGGAEWALVDEALLRQEPDRERIRERISDRWVVERSFPATLNNPTLLDINPGAAFDRVVDRQAPLTLYRPRSR
ncbi:MAG TPA: glycosyltransferase family 39 protein [Isosphaeraceae bacterium]|jgi:4-amino-4-deoxy-L-arabinose transferase-like glycosyltransferase|nr:glycosyltransferase family 39 protein [Isosphaeraceae bacterium]